MFKKLLWILVALIATTGLAWAQVDVNHGTQAELDGIKGIGPTTSRAILAERTRGGNFRDWGDLQQRVKGIGEKNSIKLSQAGLTVAGKSKHGVAPKTNLTGGQKKVPREFDVLRSTDR